MYQLSRIIKAIYKGERNIAKSALVVALCLFLASCVTAVNEKPRSEIPALAEIPILKKLLKKEEVLTCLIKGGSTHFPEGWYDFEMASFELIKGEERNVSLYRKKKLSQSAFYARFEDSGQHLVFCPVKDGLGQDEKVNCLSLYALEDDLKTGIKRTFDVPNIVRGGVIDCKQKETP